MKTLLTFFSCLIVVFIASGQIKQSTIVSKKNIVPDNHYFWSKTYDNWDIHNRDGRYRFCNFEGNIYALRGRKDGDLLVYKFSKATNHDVDFHNAMVLEDNANDYHPVYDPVGFEHKGVFYILYYYRNDESDASYYCKMFYSTDGENWDNTPRYSSGSKRDKRKFFMGAVSVGNYVYLVYNRLFKNTDDGDVIDHIYDKHFDIDVCTINDNNELEVVNTHYIKSNMQHSAQLPRSIEGFVHPDGHVRLFVSYSGEYTRDNKNLGGGVIGYSFANHESFRLYTSTHDEDEYKDYSAYSVRCIHGSIKGQRSANDVNKEYTNQLQVFTNYFHDETFGFGDEGKFYYRTYAVDADNHTYPLIERGKIVLSSDEEKPDEWDVMCMDVTNRITSSIKTDNVNEYGDLSYDQDIWLFHTDNDGYIYADIFDSDKMAVVPSEQIAGSTDLDDTKKYGAGIKKLWTLVGITDGPPPCAINWDTWDSIYGGNNTDPTELIYKQTKESEFSLSNSYSRSFYNETGVKIGLGSVASVHASFKYFNHINRANKITIHKETVNELPFALQRKTQGSAFQIWSVPDINRVSLATFPWWDDKFEHQIKGTFCYMFYTTGQKLITKTVPISEEPHGIDTSDVNLPSMRDWYSDTSPSRASIVDNFTNYPSYVDKVSTSYRNSNGTSATLSKSKERSNSYTHTHGYEIKAGTDITIIPGVFSINDEAGLEWEYESEVENSSKISNSFTVSLKSLTDPAKGILVDELDVDTYFFFNEDGVKNKDWWYYDYFNTGDENIVKPWYIAHVVTSSNAYNEEDIENPTGIEKLEADGEFSIYPNPLIGKRLNITVDNRFNNGCIVKVLSANGVEVYNSLHNFSQHRTSEIKFKNQLSAGVYFIQLLNKTANETKTAKFLVY